jgi:hypothetical protein
MSETAASSEFFFSRISEVEKEYAIFDGVNRGRIKMKRCTGMEGSRH